MSVVGQSSSQILYEEPVEYEEETFDVLDAGVASSSSQGPAYTEQASWTRGIFPNRRRRTKLFQPQAPGFQNGRGVPDQEYLDETNRAVCSLKQSPEDRITEAVTQYHPVQSGQLVYQPSTSRETETDTRRGPLQRLSFQIGSKVLHFKVVDASVTEPSTSEDSSGRFRCLGCRLMFKSVEELEKHNKVHHSTEKRYFCVVCGTAFTNRASLTIHHKIHSHTDYKTHECSICHKTFSRASNLQKHVKMHQTGKHFCDMCGRCFKDIDAMVEHQTNCVSLMNGDFVQLEKPLRYQCGYCEKLFHHKRDKKKIVLLESDPLASGTLGKRANYAIKTCRQFCGVKYHKFIHERVHTGEKPYSCGYCGRGFSQSQALTIHIRNHTGERPFSCSYCSKLFKDSSSLRKHEFSDHIQVDFMDFDDAGKIVEEPGNSSIWKLL